MPRVSKKAHRGRITSRTDIPGTSFGSAHSDRATHLRAPLSELQQRSQIAWNLMRRSNTDIDPLDALAIVVWGKPDREK